MFLMPLVPVQVLKCRSLLLFTFPVNFRHRSNLIFEMKVKGSFLVVVVALCTSGCSGRYPTHNWGSKYEYVETYEDVNGHHITYTHDLFLRKPRRPDADHHYSVILKGQQKDEDDAVNYWVEEYLGRGAERDSTLHIIYSGMQDNIDHGHDRFKFSPGDTLIRLHRDGDVYHTEWVKYTPVASHNHEDDWVRMN